jgi:hypothetical protein
MLVMIFVLIALFCPVFAGEPEFLNDFGKALDEARDRGAPIVMVFGRDR